MAYCWPSLLFLILLSLITHQAIAANITLSTELTNFVPPCAQTCFISFVTTNFQGAGCGERPSLDCLCAHNTTSGYTLGEGAVQCLISEDQVGLCKGADAQRSTLLNAYQICNGTKGALPNTHGTITATVVLQTSGVVVVPSATGLPISMTTSILSYTPSVTKPSSTAKGTTTNASIPATAKSTQGATQLTKTQITAIAAGLVGGGLVAVAIVMTILCLQNRQRRKMMAARDSDQLPFQLEPVDPKAAVGALKNDKVPTRKEKMGPGGSSSGMAGKLRKASPPQVPPRLEISTPNMFSRRSVPPEMIGMAISPGHSTVVTERTPRRSSRLLPEKPALKLTMPPPPKKNVAGGLSFAHSVIHPSAISRQSTATQFELDDDSADTAVNADDYWGRSSTDRILENKNWEAAAQNSARTPPAAIAVMRPDEFHWRPPSTSPTLESASPGLYDEKPAHGRADGRIDSFSQPRITGTHLGREGVQPPPLSIPEHHRGPSSVYSARGSIRTSDVEGNITGTRQRSYKQIGPYDAQPDKFPSAISPEEDTRYAELSPVLESPASGRSLVTYPKIPARLSKQEMLTMPPPPQPDFTKSLGAQKPWRQAEILAERDRARHAQGNYKAQEEFQEHEQEQKVPARPGAEIQIGMLSPRAGMGHKRKSSRDGIAAPTTTFSFPAPPAQSRSQTHSPSNQRQQQQPQKPQQPPRAQLAPHKHLPLDAAGNFVPQPSYPLIPLRLSTSPHPPNHLGQMQNSYSSSSITLPPPINPLSAHPSITFTRSSSLVSQSSSSSSLLARRKAGEQLGTKLSLMNEEDKKRQAAKWRVLKREEIEEAKKDGWRPKLGSPRSHEGGTSSNAEKRGQGSAIKETVREFAFERTELPRTPGWQPKLTPTRRGDELFLSVQ